MGIQEIGVGSLFIMTKMDTHTKKLKIEYAPIDSIKPFPKNAKKHTKSNIRQIANSIRDFGWRQPIVINTDGVIACGHGRYLAAQQLQCTTVPVVVADDLTEEEIAAYRLADNKTNESEWDYDLLDESLADIFNIDMADFGFDIVDPFDEHEEQKEKTQDRVENIENLGRAEFPGDGYYDIPIIKPVKKLGKIKEWIGFNYVLSDENPEGKAVHFFIDDYQFERVWKNPDAYVDKLKQYVCVASPDFSPYGDMPMALQIYNHYKKHWVAAYLQECGVTVIPTIRASTDERSFDWYLDGEPHGGIVLISSMWSGAEDIQPIFEHEYNTMLETLEPKKIFVYGKETIPLGGNVEYIKTFADTRWKSSE